MAGKGIEQTRDDRALWPQLKSQFTSLFRKKTQAEWEEIFDHTDACCTPVLDYHALRSDQSREGDQRPAVTLRDTPTLAVSKDPRLVNLSNGGDPGDGYSPEVLYPGQGGEATISRWLGWKRGEDYEVESGGLVKKPKPRL